MTLPDSTSVISSAGSRAGRSLANSPGSDLTTNGTRGVALAPPSAPPQKRKSAQSVAAALSRALGSPDISPVASAIIAGLRTSGICGPSSGGSSHSADLSASMESRLRAMTDVSGSPEYVLRWKSWAMVLGPSIIALRGSRRRICGKGFSGWPSPTAEAGNGGLQTNPFNALERMKGRSNLDDAAVLAGWPTPVANDELGSTHCYGKKTTDGSPRPRFLKLPGAALLTGWPTPMAGSPATENYNEAGNTDSSRRTVELLAGWATPTTRDHKDSVSEGTAPINGLLGRQAWGSGRKQDSGPDTKSPPAATANKGALNPALSRWLMGYTAAWCVAAIMASRQLQREKKPTKRTKPGSCASAATETVSTHMSERDSSGPATGARLIPEGDY